MTDYICDCYATCNHRDDKLCIKNDDLGYPPSATDCYHQRIVNWQEIEDQYDDNFAVCPYCHHKHGDCWEWVRENDDETECENCGKKFMIRSEVTVSYIATPIS